MRRVRTGTHVRLIVYVRDCLSRLFLVLRPDDLSMFVDKRQCLRFVLYPNDWPAMGKHAWCVFIQYPLTIVTTLAAIEILRASAFDRASVACARLCARFVCAVVCLTLCV